MADLLQSIEAVVSAVGRGVPVEQALRESAVYTYYYAAPEQAAEQRCPPTTVNEVSPPRMKKMVKKMKKHREIDNPYALAWWMKKQGHQSHYDGQEPAASSVLSEESYSDYVGRYRAAQESKVTMGPFLGPQDHALASRVLVRLLESRRDSVRVQELRDRLLLASK